MAKKGFKIIIKKEDLPKRRSGVKPTKTHKSKKDYKREKKIQDFDA